MFEEDQWPQSYVRHADVWAGRLVKALGLIPPARRWFEQQYHQARPYIQSLGLKVGDPLARAQMSRPRVIRQIEQEVRSLAPPLSEARTILLVNFSARAGQWTFHSLVGNILRWSLRLGGCRVLHVPCQAAMSRCVAEVARNPRGKPNCSACWQLTQTLSPSSDRAAIHANSTGQTCRRALEEMDFEDMVAWEYRGLKLGQLALPSLRWALRTVSLDPDDPTTRELLAHFIASAAEVADRFTEVLDRVEPQSVLAFNGMFYPEATARLVALRRDLDVVTYESGFRRNSVFLSHGQATQAQIEVDHSRPLDPAIRQKMNVYLGNRFSGKFYMGGRRYWARMTRLEGLETLRRRHDRLVTVFTNVAFDTTQSQASLAFETMFDWLTEIGEIAARRRGTLFIIRAHPDELRPHKASRQTVEDHLAAQGILKRSNVLFIRPDSKTDSYQLLRSADLCLAYNSTIGVESVILGCPLLYAARGKYDGHGIGLQARSPAEFRARLEEMLTGSIPPVTQEQRDRAIRYLYHLVFRASLPLTAYLQGPLGAIGYRPIHFDVRDLLPERSEVMDVIHKGFTQGGSFML